MKIDKEKLVELLVEKTSMERAEVEKQLDQLIDRILDAAHRGKALEIKEFGVFYFDEEGELKFDPSKELSTEISFKYAGMKPIELQPERDTAISIGDVKPEETETEETAEPADSDSESTEDEKKPAEDDTDDIFGIEETKEDTSDVFEAEDDEDFDFLSDAVKESETEMDIWDEVARQEEEEQRKKEEERKKVEAAKARVKPKKKKKSNAAIWAIAALLLLLVLAGLYFIFLDNDTVAEDPQQTATAEHAVPIPDELPVITDEDAEVAREIEMIPVEPEQVPEDEVSETEEVQETQPEAITQTALNEQETYGLMGMINDEANDGYSIVLHSFTSEDNAREAAAHLSEEGYRVLVTSRTVTEETMWRVSVGQFETLADAQQNLNRLPPPYNVQNFIHRIQIN